MRSHPARPRGHRSRLENPESYRPREVARQVEAVVVALDLASERMTVRQTVDDLRFSELWAPPEAAEQVEVSDRVTLYLDIHGRAVGGGCPTRIGVREDYR